MLNNITWILCINSTNRLFFFFNSWFYFSYDRYKNLRGSLFWVFGKKRNFCLHDFFFFFLSCLCDQLCWQIDLPGSLPAWVLLHRSYWQVWVHAQIKLSNEWTNFFEWKKSNFIIFFQNVLFKWMFDSNDSVPLQFFWLKHNSDEYFFFHKYNLQLVWQSLNISKSHVCHMDSTSTELSGN